MRKFSGQTQKQDEFFRHRLEETVKLGQLVLQLSRLKA
jgi:hypothetical protein